ncbi:thermonuclease family protein [Candidatus Gracilibacteria bacterium]|nr:thermonuclease family protein [Candidatus Gracilibacteria bacterium]
MKKYVLILSLFLIIFIPISYGAILTQQDFSKIDLITNKIEKIISSKGEIYREKFIKALNSYKTSKSDKIKNIIEKIIDELNNKVEYTITDVIDGDTVKIIYNGTGTTVRILGLDTPEKYTTRTGYVECYGEEASNFAKTTLLGKKVNIISDYTQDKIDKYGRLLAHIKMQDGNLFQNLAIKNGYGFYYLYNIPTKFDSEFKKSELEAKNNNLGVWKYCEGKRKSLDTKVNTGTINSNVPVVQPIINNFSCNIKKTYCSEMKTCEEAKFYLNTCKITRLDANDDGVPCESLCQ